MAGGHSEAKPSKAIFYLLGLLWVLTVIIIGYLYLSHRFVLFSNTLTPESTSTSTSSRSNFVVSSPAFGDGESIPSLYTCDEKQISPPLAFSGAPEKTRSLVVIMEDRDVPKNLKPDGVFLHWSVFDIPASTKEIGIGELVGVQGATGNGVAGYVGPCPPPQYEPAEHRYYIDAFALDTTLGLSEGASIDSIRTAMDGHILTHATLIGRYERVKQ